MTPPQLEVLCGWFRPSPTKPPSPPTDQAPHLVSLRSPAVWRNRSDLDLAVRAELAAVRDLDSKQRDELADYVVSNLRTLERDWAIFCDLAPEALPAAPPPPVERMSIDDGGGYDPTNEAHAIEDEDDEAAEGDVAKMPSEEAVARRQADERSPEEAVASLPPSAPYAGGRALFGRADLGNAYWKQSYAAEPGKAYSNAAIKSLLQKAIRRNLPELAHFAAAMMLASFQVTNLCNRLMMIASEDIGIGNTACLRLAVELNRLKVRLWNDREKDKLALPGGKRVARWRHDLRDSAEFREMLHRVVGAMCTSAKTRLCDHIAMIVMDPKQVTGLAADGELQLALERGAPEEEVARLASCKTYR